MPQVFLGGTVDEVKDLNRARAYLRDLADRYGVDVYDDVEAAVAAVAGIL